MIKIKITPEIAIRVRNRINEAPFPNRINRFGRVVGYVVEECFFEAFDNLKRERHEDRFNNDAVLDKFKVEIKSEMRKKAPNMKLFEFSTENFLQDPDFYLIGQLEGWDGGKIRGYNDIEILELLQGFYIHAVGIISKKKFNENCIIEKSNDNFTSETFRKVCKYRFLEDIDNEKFHKILGVKSEYIQANRSV